MHVKALIFSIIFYSRNLVIPSLVSYRHLITGVKSKHWNDCQGITRIHFTTGHSNTDTFKSNKIGCVRVCLVAQSCPTLCDPMDDSPLGSSVLGLLQARILEWVAIPFSRGSSWPRDWTQVSWVSRQILYLLSHEGSPSLNRLNNNGCSLGMRYKSSSVQFLLRIVMGM